MARKYSVVTSASFAYESFFAEQIRQKKLDHSYRVFKKVNRSAEAFPAAREFSLGISYINHLLFSMLCIVIFVYCY